MTHCDWVKYFFLDKIYQILPEDLNLCNHTTRIKFIWPVKSLYFWKIRVFMEEGQVGICWILSDRLSWWLGWSQFWKNNGWRGSSMQKIDLERVILSVELSKLIIRSIADSWCGHSPVWREDEDPHVDDEGAKEDTEVRRDPPHHYTARSREEKVRTDQLSTATTVQNQNNLLS